MICVKALVRQVEAGEHARALSRVLENGRAAEKGLQAWLRRNPRELPVVALGLALTRLAELTYGPTDEGSRLADRLLLGQREAGGFGSDGFCPVSTAVALAGLLFHLDQYAQVSQQPNAPLVAAADRASIALADWIIDQRVAGKPSEELALARMQLEATTVLNVTTRGLLHGTGAPVEAPTAHSAAA